MSHLEDSYNDVIQKARLGRGISVRALADVLGVEVATIVEVERGKTAPSEALAKFLKLSYPKLACLFNHSYMPHAIPQIILEGCVLKQFLVDVGGIVSNAYVFTKQGRALLIDAVGVSKEALEYIQGSGLIVCALLITHGHFDHTAGMELVKERFGEITVVCAGKDVLEDWKVPLDGFAVHVYKTPGHSEDSVCYLVEGRVMFVGDTIFAGSVGKPNYSYQLLLDNIRAKIFTLDESLILAPGHGQLTTVGEEKAHNPFF